jgi:hypothetical protein
MCGQFHVKDALSWEKNLWYPLNSRLHGHHSCPVHVEEEKNLSLPGTEQQFLDI